LKRNQRHNPTSTHQPAAHVTSGEEIPKKFRSAKLGYPDEKGTGSRLPRRGTNTSSAARIEPMIRKGKKRGVVSWCMGSHGETHGERERIKTATMVDGSGAVMPATRTRPRG
jgi:hypothetical protein